MSLTSGKPETAIVRFKMELFGKVIQNYYTDTSGNVATTDLWTSTWYNGWYKFEWDESLLDDAG